MWRDWNLFHKAKQQDVNHFTFYLLKSPLAGQEPFCKVTEKSAAAAPKRRGCGFALDTALRRELPHPHLHNGRRIPKGSVFNKTGGAPRSAAQMGKVRAWQNTDNRRREAVFGMCRIEMLMTLLLCADIKAEDVPHLWGK